MEVRRRFLEPEREARRRERVGGAVGVEALDGERRRLAWLPVEVVLADRHRQRAIGQRHAVRLVTLAAEQDLEVVARLQAELVRAQLRDRRR